MKRSPIVTTRDARLSLWTSLAESLLKKNHPELSMKEIRNLPMMRGVFAHVNEASGQATEALSPEAKTQQEYSKKMYNLASSSTKEALERLVEACIDVLEGKNVAALEAEYTAALDALGIRFYSDDDLANWILMTLEWLVVVNAYEYTKLPWYKKALKALKDLTNPIADLVGKWLLQSSDTEIQQNLIQYRDWTSQSYSVIPWTLPNDARVVMLGDWGTSLDDAKQLLKAIWAQENPHAFVHLGDIYYSGTQEECENNFLNVFKSVASELGKPMVPVFTIPGNHEYYSFGDGFFWLVDHMNTGNQKQAASYFCLRTQDSKWQFLAMDTGQDDNNPIVTAIASFAPKLMGDRDSKGELAWHADKLKNFAGNTILMSHHQLFSRAASIDGKVTPYFSRYLHSYFSPYFNKISAWFWGHEHSFAIYQNGIYGLEKGRLLGSSSYEESTSNNPYDNNFPLVPYASFNAPNHSNGYYDHVCAVLDFNRATPDADIAVRYYTFPSWGQDDSMPTGAALGNIYNETLGKSTMKSQTWSGNDMIDKDTVECEGTPSLATDGSSMYMAYRGTNSDHLRLAIFDLSKKSWEHVYDLNLNTSHSPSISFDASTKRFYILYADKDNSNKLTYTYTTNGTSWSSPHHVNDSSSNNISVGSGISSVFMGGVLYITFVEDGTDNIRFVIFNGSTGSYSYPGGNPESNNLTPGLAASGNTVYMVYADKNNHNYLCAEKYVPGSGWASSGQITNGHSGSSEDMAYPKAFGNISAVTEANGNVTVFYRGESYEINWLTFDTGNHYWFGGVSLPRIGNDKDVPMTSESAGAVGLSNGVYLCFRGKSTNDIRWARRTDA